ncbi:hypothetical protein SPACI_056290 [Sporomusa acidovorans DSM 3132]|uniref:Uncharacterized protein n=1 Tax=Sporomusa acidovorans (strain ATCC 49682 / DSM 3132 / Mol) TaxID=1123286 RepID=A0ABZ3JBT7_SPOA4|nr:hypothetical protein SPACI_39460 [Sporomusa acidovorans DSM 3132]SDF33044.1 hypothetical protein SAMN04488499_10443 [Sporomusa acidovorans]
MSNLRKSSNDTSISTAKQQPNEQLFSEKDKKTEKTVD